VKLSICPQAPDNAPENINKLNSTPDIYKQKLVKYSTHAWPICYEVITRGWFLSDDQLNYYSYY